MANNKHLTQKERFSIQSCLEKQMSMKAIAIELDKDCTTISKEIRNHLVFKKSGAFGRAYNSCIHRKKCDVRTLCSTCTRRTNNPYCASCGKCNSHCPDFKQEHCTRLEKPPYVCNGCSDKIFCTLEKHFYDPASAHAEYKKVLSEARTGLSFTEAEINHLDTLISPLIYKGQSLNHICVNHKDSIMVSERTIYRLIDYNLFSARNIDLPRKVSYKPRKTKKIYKVDKQCRIGRTYEDFQNYMAQNPDLPVTQLDSVEGVKGGKVLLTIHFVETETMLAFLRDANDSQSVINIIDKLYLEIRPDRFLNLMPILLVDNGSEFSNPKALEFDSQGNQRTRVFYCDASAPYQKGSAERNHELIRYFIPKGTSMNALTQEKISCMMDHINSHCRKSLRNKCPYDMFSFLHGKRLLKALGCAKIPADEVTLKKTIWNKDEQ